jgi:hypothetical protein
MARQMGEPPDMTKPVSRRFVSRGAAIAALLVLGLSTLQLAVAHEFVESSSISIGYRSGAFRGKVSSPRAACRGSRLVKLVRRGVGVVASKQTTSTGRWSIRRPGAKGTYYASIGRRVTASYGHSHDCKAARSRLLKR